MSNDNKSIKEIINSLEGVELKEKHGGKFRFIMYLNNTMSAAPIDDLDLSIRAGNSLKRAGYKNIGEVAVALSGGAELKNIRNCGTKSAREIMEKLFLYQYNSLDSDEKKEYLSQIVLINCRP